MAATEYQILYRATNSNTGIVISNSPTVQVEHLAELYHNKHKMNTGSAKEKKEATDKKSDDIINGNNADNVKYAQLYQYSGTRRLNKMEWIPKKTGYVITDYEAIRDKITNTNFGDEHGDYSGEYLLFEGDTPENGIVVARENPMLTEHQNNAGVFEIKDNYLAENGMFYKNLDEVKQLLINSTIAQIDWVEHPWLTSLHGILNGGTDGQSKYFNLPTQTDNRSDVVNYHQLTVFIGSMFNPSQISNNNYSLNPNKVYDYLPKGTIESGINQGKFACSRVVLNPNYIKTYEIPGHWEESSEVPYIIHDKYEKVAQEPWFPYCTTRSLESALEKAKALVEKIGLENVKLIKVVPISQFLKLK
jgi:hypothetical protein